MSVFSPALVVAMCVMFVLTRLHRHYYIFEHPFLFGLIYCLQPAGDQLEAIMKASSSAQPSQPAQSGKKRGKPIPAKPSAATPKTKLSAASLSVRRNLLTETFFSSEAEFPHHRELDHLMAICCGYFAAHAFEETVGCFYPHLLANKRSAYVAVFGVGFAIVESLRISVGMTSVRIMLILGGMAWLVALFLISGGDFVSFIRFDEAFAGLGQFVISTLTGPLMLDETTANVYAGRAAMMGRLFVATVAALISASVAAPARYFSKLDYELHLEYREEEHIHRDDPYYLGRPTAFTMLKIALDYVVPALALFMWCVSPRGTGPYGAWRIMVLLACVYVRFATLRIRLQAYLDGAVDGYRSFWAEKSVSNAEEAGRRTTIQVIRNSFYLIMITMVYVSPAVISLLLACVAKLDGAVSMGICPVGSSKVVQPNEIFAREVAAFLSWWCIASYLSFACISIAYEAVVNTIDPAARDRRVKLPPASSSSERRKQKRMMRQGTA